MVYNVAEERAYGRVSVPTDRDDNRGLLYLGGTQPLGPSFNPDYRYVLTRLAGISTARHVVRRDSPIALGAHVGARRHGHWRRPGGRGALRSERHGVGQPAASAPLPRRRHVLRRERLDLARFRGAGSGRRPAPAGVSEHPDRAYHPDLPACLGVPPVREQPAPVVREPYAPALPPRGAGWSACGCRQRPTPRVTDPRQPAPDELLPYAGRMSLSFERLNPDALVQLAELEDRSW